MVQIDKIKTDFEQIKAEEKAELVATETMRNMIIRKHKEFWDKEPTQEEITFDFDLIEDCLSFRGQKEKAKSFKERFFKNYKSISGKEATEEQYTKFKGLWNSKNPMNIYRFVEENNEN